MENKPKFKHDCDKCLFLGHYRGYDCYICPNKDNGTLVARNGNDGTQYASVPLFCFEAIIHSECRKAEYIQAWIEAAYKLNEALKLIPLVDTLQDYAEQNNNSLC